jgi:hypothetical protein
MIESCSRCDVFTDVGGLLCDTHGHYALGKVVSRYAGESQAGANNTIYRWSVASSTPLCKILDQ